MATRPDNDADRLIEQSVDRKVIGSKRKHRKLITDLALSGSNSDAVVQYLALVLNGDSDDFARALAAKGLGSKTGAEAQDSLLRGGSDPSAKVRAQVAAALASHPSPSSVDALARMLGEDEDGVVRQSAANALAEIGGDSAREGLLAAIQHQDARTRMFVIYALKDLGDVSVLPVLSRRQDEETRLNKGAIESALKHLKSIESD